MRGEACAGARCHVTTLNVRRELTSALPYGTNGRRILLHKDDADGKEKGMQTLVEHE